MMTMMMILMIMAYATAEWYAIVSQLSNLRTPTYHATSVFNNDSVIPYQPNDQATRSHGF